MLFLPIYVAKKTFLILWSKDLKQKNIFPKGYPANKVERHTIYNLRYAEDTALIAENKENLQRLLDIVEEEREREGWK